MDVFFKLASVLKLSSRWTFDLFSALYNYFIFSTGDVVGEVELPMCLSSESFFDSSIRCCAAVFSDDFRSIVRGMRGL